MLSARYLQLSAARLPKSITTGTSTFAVSNARRHYSTDDAPQPKPKSAHSTLYSSIFPAMIPVFLLGSAVYLGLQLTQLKLAHEKHMQETLQLVHLLEVEIDDLQKLRATQAMQPQPSNNAEDTTAKSPKEPSRWRWW